MILTLHTVKKRCKQQEIQLQSSKDPSGRLGGPPPLPDSLLSILEDCLQNKICSKHFIQYKNVANNKRFNSNHPRIHQEDLEDPPLLDSLLSTLEDSLQNKMCSKHFIQYKNVANNKKFNSNHPRIHQEDLEDPPFLTVFCPLQKIVYKTKLSRCYWQAILKFWGRLFPIPFHRIKD